MADELKPIRIIISADSREAQQAMERAEVSLGKFSRGLRSFEQAAQGGERYSEQLKNSIKDFEARAQAAAEKTDKLSAEYEAMQKSGSASAEELAELAQQLSRAQAEAERYATRLADARAEQLALDNGVAALYKQMREAADATLNQAAQLDAMGDAAGAAQARAQGLQTQQQLLLQITQALQTAMGQATTAMGANSAEAGRLQAAYTSANAALDKTNAAIRSSTGNLDSNTGEIVRNTLSWGELGDTLTNRVTQPLLDIGKSALQAAADAQAMESSFDSVFGAQAEGARLWSQNLAESLNASETHIRESMLSWQTLFNGMEVSGKKSAEMVTNLTERAYDMAALFDQDVTVVMEKMRSAMVGNHETMRDLGVVITETTLKEAAYAKGIARRGTELTEQQKIMTRYKLIMEQSEQAQGRWNAEAGDTSGKLRTLGEMQEEISRKLGEALLPLLDKLLDVITPIADFLAQMNGTGWGVVAVVAALVAALGPVLKIITLINNLKLAKGIQTVSTAASGLNAFLGGPMFATLSKVLMIVVAVAAAIALVAAAIALANGNAARYAEAQNASGGVAQQVNRAANQVKRVGRNARGTPYWRGGPTWVGEEGPEIIDLPQGSRVYPANEARRRTISGDTYIFNVDFEQVSDVQKFLDTAKAARRLSRQGASQNV